MSPSEANSPDFQGPMQSRLASLASRFPPIISNIRKSVDSSMSSHIQNNRSKIDSRRSSSDMPMSLSSFVQSKPQAPEYSRQRSRNTVPGEILTTRANGNKKQPSRSPTFPSLTGASPTTPAPSSTSDKSDETLRLLITPKTSEEETRTRKLVRRSGTESSLSEPKWLEAKPFLGHRRPKIFDKYKPVKSIGKGQYGTVFQVVERRDSSVTMMSSSGDDEMTTRRSAEMMKEEPQAFACKVVDLTSRDDVDADNSAEAVQSRMKDVMNEIDMMAGPGAGHPNVQEIVDYVVEDDKAYIVSSLCRGGDLSQALEMRGCLCEEDARNVMAGILRGLAHLHSRGVAHRDIKLENILLTDSKHDMSKVKIIDMGFAKQLVNRNATPPNIEALNTVCGTPMYIAPEMIRPTVRTGEIQSEARYGTQADMWSCGVILFCLLSGCPPFEATDNTTMFELFSNIEEAAYDFWDPVWETVSEDALAIIEALLEADPSKRLTAEEALRHPWMSAL